MKNGRIYKITGSLVITFLLLATIVTPALAVGVKAGDVLVISSDVDDDLYAAARNFTLSATIHGDLIVAAQTITIEPGGVVEGDILGVGQDIIIQGEVKGDVRVAGGVLILSSTGKVDEDLVAAGYSLELEPGSQVGIPDKTVGGDVIFAGSQASFSGIILRDADMAGEGLEVNGTVGGNLKAFVGQVKAERFPLGTIPGLNEAQTIPGGLTFGPQAKIDGTLEYTSPEDVIVPATVIASDKVTFHQKNFHWERVQSTRSVSAISRATAWFLNQFRWFLSLLLVGLLLAWVTPEFIHKSAEHLQNKPLYSLGWGFVSIFALIFGLLSLIVILGMLGVLLGILKLGGLLTLVIILGFMALFGIVMVYVVAAVIVSKVVVGYLGGRLILARIKPEWAESRIWPLLLGLVIFAILTALPLYVGQLFNLVIILLGLGALWMASSEWIRHQSSKPEELS
jgi:cytoskeletal protein CcmA (bactofilin family)